MTSPVMDRLAARIEAADSMLCVGLDVALERIPASYRSSATPQLDFGRAIIDRTHPYVAAYKPNLAFYEARAAAGWAELAATLAHLRSVDPGILVIADAKRGDIDSTNEGYVRGLLDELGFDGITLHPYLGKEALQPFLARADKAAIILCRTSNAGAGELQDLAVDGTPLWEVVATRVRDAWNVMGNCMLVIGATYPAELRRARELCPDMTFLVPGVGAQGGDAGTVVRQGADRQGRGLLVNASRSVILSADPGAEARRLRDEMRIASLAAMATVAAGGGPHG